MSEGIGASVQRKEDKKFLTGKGRYTDDINRPGQTHAYFVRSDIAHANIKINSPMSRCEAAELALANSPAVFAKHTSAQLHTNDFLFPVSRCISPFKTRHSTCTQVTRRISLI